MEELVLTDRSRILVRRLQGGTVIMDHRVGTTIHLRIRSHIDLEKREGILIAGTVGQVL